MNSKTFGIWLVPVFLFLGAGGIWAYRIFRPLTPLEVISRQLQNFELASEEKAEELIDNYSDGDEGFSLELSMLSLQNDLDYNHTAEPPGSLLQTPYFHASDQAQTELLWKQSQGLHEIGYIDDKTFSRMREMIASGRVNSLLGLFVWLDSYEYFQDFHTRGRIFEYILNDFHDMGFLDSKALSDLKRTYESDPQNFDPRLILRYFERRRAVAINAWNPQDAKSAEEAYRKIASIHPKLAFEGFQMERIPGKGTLRQPGFIVEIDFGDEVLQDEFFARMPPPFDLERGVEDDGFPAYPSYAFRIFNMRLRSQEIDLRMEELIRSETLLNAFSSDSVHMVLMRPEDYARKPELEGGYLIANAKDFLPEECIASQLREFTDLNLVDADLIPRLDSLAHVIYLKGPATRKEILKMVPGTATPIAVSGDSRRKHARRCLQEFARISQGYFHNADYSLAPDYGSDNVEIEHDFQYSGTVDTQLRSYEALGEGGMPQFILPIANEILVAKQLARKYATYSEFWDLGIEQGHFFTVFIKNSTYDLDEISYSAPCGFL